MYVRIAVFILAVLGALCACAADVTQTRQHQVANDAQGQSLFTLTEVSILSSAAHDNYVLVRDDGTNEMWILNRRMDFVEHVSTYEIRDLRGEIFLRMSQPLEFNGDTREEYLAEYRANPALVSAVNPPVTIESGGVIRTAAEGEWNKPENQRAWRSEFRRQMNPNLLEAVERMRLLYTRLPVSIFYDLLFVHVLYGAGTPEGGLTLKAATPDCAFDASFGFECTERQLKRIAEAEKSGKTLARY